MPVTWSSLFNRTKIRGLWKGSPMVMRIIVGGGHGLSSRQHYLPSPCTAELGRNKFTCIYWTWWQAVCLEWSLTTYALSYSAKGFVWYLHISVLMFSFVVIMCNSALLACLSCSWMSAFWTTILPLLAPHVIDKNHFKKWSPLSLPLTNWQHHLIQ